MPANIAQRGASQARSQPPYLFVTRKMGLARPLAATHAWFPGRGSSARDGRAQPTASPTRQQSIGSAPERWRRPEGSTPALSASAPAPAWSNCRARQCSRRGRPTSDSGVDDGSKTAESRGVAVGAGTPGPGCPRLDPAGYHFLIAEYRSAAHAACGDLLVRRAKGSARPRPASLASSRRGWPCSTRVPNSAIARRSERI